MFLETDAPKRRRETSRKYVEIHNARRLIHDSQRALGGWRSQVARLRALMSLRKGDTDQLRLEASQLLPAVVARRIELERAIEAADPTVAAHSMVRDIRKAFHGLEDDLIVLSSPDAAHLLPSEIGVDP